jgi:2-polyprenyl-3-methyl-5-hydroxy-6-metoxy-1,4-benzoquinol methylase
MQKLVLNFVTLFGVLLSVPFLHAQEESCQRFLNKISSLIERDQGAEWPSQVLMDHSLRDLPAHLQKLRIRMIVNQAFATDTSLEKELHSVQFKLAEHLYDHYMHAYESFLYSSSHQNVMSEIEKRLPRKGHILDIGAGTGAMSAYFSQESLERKFSVLESPIFKNFEQTARRRFEYSASEGNKTLTVVKQHLSKLTDEVKANSADAVVINHMLYTVKDAGSQNNVMKAVVAKMNPGAKLILNEPLSGKALPENQGYKAWLESVFVEAIQNGAPHTEYDLAFLASLSSGQFSGSLQAAGETRAGYRDLEGWKKLGMSHGLILEEQVSTHNGFSIMLVFRKP